MKIKQLLELGVEKAIITASQCEELLKLTDNKPSEIQPPSIVIKTLYYIGGFFMLCAMIYLMSETVIHSSYFVILSLGTLYALIFLFMGEFLWRNDEKFPAGILYLLFVASVAFIILDIEKMTGFFPRFSDIDKIANYDLACRMPTLVLSILTIAVNTILQKYRKISNLALPTIFFAYPIYIILLNYIMKDNIYGTHSIININFVFSIGLFIIAFIKDRRTEADYSKWMYLFSSIGIWGSMFVIFQNYFDKMPPIEVFQGEMFVLSIAYCLCGALINRKPFSIIGILGIIEYIMYLEFNYLPEYTLIITTAVLVTGLLILYAGVLCHQNSAKISAFLEGLLPEKVRQYLPQNRDTK